MKKFFLELNEKMKEKKSINEISSEIVDKRRRQKPFNDNKENLWEILRKKMLFFLVFIN